VVEDKEEEVIRKLVEHHSKKLCGGEQCDEVKKRGVSALSLTLFNKPHRLYNLAHHIRHPHSQFSSVPDPLSVQKTHGSGVILHA
jgi:hypothetical protein